MPSRGVEPGALDAATLPWGAPLEVTAPTAASMLRAAGTWSLDAPARRFDAEDWPWAGVFLEQRRGVTVDDVHLAAALDGTTGTLDVTCRARVLGACAIAGGELIATRDGAERRIPLAALLRPSPLRRTTLAPCLDQSAAILALNAASVSSAGFTRTVDVLAPALLSSAIV